MRKRIVSGLLIIFIIFVFLCCKGITIQVAERKTPSLEIPQSYNYTWLIEPKYKRAGRFSEGLWPVQHENGLWGYVDSADNVVIDFKYREAFDFNNGIAFVHTSSDIITDDKGKPREQKYLGLMDKNEHYLIEPRLGLNVSGYEHPAVSSFLVAFRTMEGKYGFLNLSGDVQIPAQYDGIESSKSFSEDKAAVKIGDLWGIIDTKGEWIAPPNYEKLRYYWKGHIAFLDKDVKLWGFLDERGKIVLEPKYTIVTYNIHYEGPWIIELEEKYGVLDENLKVLIEPRYKERSKDRRMIVSAHRGGLFFLDDSGVYKAIDMQGNENFSFPAILLEPGNAIGGYYVLMKTNTSRSCLVNEKGKVLLPLEFGALYPSAEGIIPAFKGGLWGLIKVDNQ